MKNNFSTYITYAFGEIILVVIGILIALMINSWWQDRQDRNYEVLMLEEMAESVNMEMENVESLNARADNRAAAINQILGAIHRGELDFDSVSRVSYTRSKYGNLFSYDPSIYESLKLKGLEKIRNDSVRKNIIVFYELILPRAKDFMNSNFGVPEQQLVYELEDPLFQYESKKLSSGSFTLVKKPVSGILQRPEMLRLMELYEGDLEYYRFRAQGLQRQIQSVLDILEKEKERIR